MSRLSFLREGVPEHKITVIPGTEEKVAIATLNNKEIIRAREESIKYMSDKVLDSDTQDLIFNIFILKECLRDPKDINVHYVESHKEIMEYMDPYIVNKLNAEFIEFQSNTIPEFQDLTVDEFEDIKKKLEKMNLKELDGELQTILKHFLVQMNLKDLLMAK